MIKNLVITDIPKEVHALEKVLLAIGDHTWSTEGKEKWVNNTTATCIWYCKKYASYMSGNHVTYDSKHNYKTYKQVIRS